MPRPKKLCYVCGKRKPRSIDSIYVHATTDPIFCSHRCAAHYGLLSASKNETECGIFWCKQHGWQNCWATYEGCYHCMHDRKEH